MKKLILILLLFTVSWQAFSQQHISEQVTKAEVLNEKYCSALFATNDADYFDLLNDATVAADAYLNILDWLHGRVAGLQVFTTRDLVRIPVIRHRLATVYVDEVPVTYDYLNLLPVADIAMVKVIKGPFIGNSGGAAGAIAIYTIQGDEEFEE